MVKVRDYYGKTPTKAAYRVKLKHAIRRKGLTVRPGAATKTLEHLYKKNVSKKLPK